MSAKQKFLITLIVLVALLAIGLVVIFYFYSQNQKPVGVNKNISKKTNSQVININQGAMVNTNESSVINTNQETAPANISEEKEKDYVLKLAKNFAERFGTYSNQNESSNLLGLKDYMTKDMKNWVDEVIAKNKNKPNEVYYSVVARATTINLQEFDSGQNKAKVTVGAIKQETKGWPASESEYQEKLEMEFKKIDGTWKVNSAYWHRN